MQLDRSHKQLLADISVGFLLRLEVS